MGEFLPSMQGPVFSPQYYKKKQLKKINLKLFLFLNLHVWLWLMFCRIHTDKRKEERNIFTCITYLVRILIKVIGINNFIKSCKQSRKKLK